MKNELIQKGGDANEINEMEKIIEENNKVENERNEAIDKEEEGKEVKIEDNEEEKNLEENVIDKAEEVKEGENEGKEEEGNVEENAIDKAQEENEKEDAVEKGEENEEGPEGEEGPEEVEIKDDNGEEGNKEEYYGYIEDKENDENKGVLHPKDEE
jgi:hypothetical protein